jgi:predicted translin family RNA/ssDNA-binding protein
VYQASRDLTRASKKLISLLQRCTHSTPAERVKLLESARTQQLTELHHMLAATIADFKEEEYHRYAGAYSPGFQEFIESASLLHYLEHGECRYSARRSQSSWHESSDAARMI